MFRTHNCGELKIDDVGKEVRLAGWVQTVRKFGSITFVDLRDRYGITQLFFYGGTQSYFETNPLGREYVIIVQGKVQERSDKNSKIPTGDIEVYVDHFKILNEAKTPPFTIEEDTDGGDELRMKYRYLDLRRPTLKRNLELRYKVNRSVRNYLDTQGFWDIETPFLIRSTPEGARDFVVPSRMNEGQFYALPQSPQTFKQLLMVSGYDRYYQIVKCFRDEDLRADRQPEFTQVDCEMSFVEQEDILNTFEGLFKHVFKDVKGVEITEAFPRMTFDDAMWHYGNDKPDIRFEIKIQNAKVKNEIHCAALAGAGFKVFDDAETILMICAPGCSEYTRKQTDELTEWVKRPQIGMTGVVYIKCNTDGTYKSSVDKFYNEEKLKEIASFCGAEAGDLILILAGAETRTRKAMSELRLLMGERLGYRDHAVYKPLWVIDFPLFELDEENNRWMARHHPFTSPKPEHIEWMNDVNKYGDIKANAYDIVLNGTEIGGGSIRIFRRELQEKMFAALGMSKEEAQDKFGFLMGAFEYGAPPHGGIAFGFDRLCALLGGQETIRDFIAFPKNNSGRDVMLDAPSAIDEVQMKELGLLLSKTPTAKNSQSTNQTSIGEILEHLGFLQKSSIEICRYLSGKELSTIQLFCLGMLRRISDTVTSTKKLFELLEDNPQDEFTIGIMYRVLILDSLISMNLFKLLKDLEAQNKTDEETQIEVENFCNTFLSDGLSTTLAYIQDAETYGMKTSLETKETFINIANTFKPFFENYSGDGTKPLLKYKAKYTAKNLFEALAKSSDLKEVSKIYDSYAYLSKYDHFGIIYYQAINEDISNKINIYRNVTDAFIAHYALIHVVLNQYSLGDEFVNVQTQDANLYLLEHVIRRNLQRQR